MKLTQSVVLKQSLQLNPSITMAINMLAMSSAEIEELIDQELETNFCLKRSESENHRNSHSAFEIALDTIAHSNDFRDHLWNQVKLSRFNSIERDIAQVIINNLDDDGLFSDSESVTQQIINEQQVFFEWVSLVRQKIMALEPISCGALNINEALTYQITTLFQHKPTRLLALLAEINHQPNVKLSLNNIRQACDSREIRKLKLIYPRPAQAFINLRPQENIIVPDLVMRINNDDFLLSLVNAWSGILAVDTSYQDSRIKIIKNQQKNAAFFIKSLRFRENSLISIATAIIKRQKDYFFKHQAPNPMILADIARDTGLHESSVSRLVKNKYLASNRGMHELKYFFSQAAHDKSSIAIKDMIKNLLKHEDKAHPLSDQQISETLAKVNVPLARRTVAKYRESLGIANTNQRCSVFSST